MTTTMAAGSTPVHTAAPVAARSTGRSSTSVADAGRRAAHARQSSPARHDLHAKRSHARHAATSGSQPHSTHARAEQITHELEDTWWVSDRHLVQTIAAHVGHDRE